MNVRNERKISLPSALLRGEVGGIERSIMCDALFSYTIWGGVLKRVEERITQLRAPARPGKGGGGGARGNGGAGERVGVREVRTRGCPVTVLSEFFLFR